MNFGLATLLFATIAYAIFTLSNVESLRAPGSSHVLPFQRRSFAPRSHD